LSSVITRFTSAIPEVTALNGTKRFLTREAINRASVVFPDPGGPHRIIRLRDASRIECCAQEGTGSHDARLSYQLVDRAWTHAIGKRSRARLPRAGSRREQIEGSHSY
jgi:hypothetical protein